MVETDKESLDVETAVQVAGLLNLCPDLLNDKRSVTHQVIKALALASGTEGPAGSNVREQDGHDMVLHPYSMLGAATFRAYNPHHGACLDMLPKLTVGAGFSSGMKVEDVLDELSGDGSFMSSLLSALDNQTEFGMGYLEVVRDDPSDSTSGIAGIHWIQAPHVWKVQAPIDDKNPRARPHLTGYAVQDLSISGLSVSTALPAPSIAGGAVFGPMHAPFGRAKEFIDAHELDADAVSRMSEVIEFSGPRTRGHYYSIPRWLSVVPALELIQAGVQHEFDYFYNKGMPYWMLLLLGEKIEPKSFAAMKLEMANHVGIGNTHKGAMFNMGDTEGLKAQMFELGSKETNKSRFVENADQMGTWIVSAHGIPARLAGIVLPGKIGAVNEAVTDVWLAETTTLNPARRDVCKTLARTLGNPKCNGGLGLSKEDFLGAEDRKGVGFWTLLEDDNIAAINGMARMKDPAATTDRPADGGPLRNGQDRARVAG